MRIEVMQHHIDEARRLRKRKDYWANNHCPVALAVRDQRGGQWVSVRGLCIHFPNGENYWFDVETGKKILRWDQLGEMEPFSFETEKRGMW